MTPEQKNDKHTDTSSLHKRVDE